MHQTERLERAPRDHVVQFYDRDDELVASAGDYLAEAVRTGGAAVFVGTPAHRVAFEAHLAAVGIDVAAALVDGSYLALDAAETMASFLVDDEPDAVKFDAVIGGLVRRIAANGRRVRAYGEMVALLWDAGQVNAAIALESLWNDLAADVDFSLYCAYPAASVSGHDRADEFLQVCHLHSEVVDRCDAVRGFPATPHGATDARHFVVAALRDRGQTSLLDDAALVVTELAANAALHARSEFSVELSWRGDGVRIAVRDASPLAPRVRTALPLDTGGRGLRLIAAIADRWGAHASGSGRGKVVWAELRR